jgi:hypothetical protein
MASANTTPMAQAHGAMLTMESGHDPLLRLTIEKVLAMIGPAR